MEFIRNYGPLPKSQIPAGEFHLARPAHVLPDCNYSNQVSTATGGRGWSIRFTHRPGGQKEEKAIIDLKQTLIFLLSLDPIKNANYVQHQHFGGKKPSDVTTESYGLVAADVVVEEIRWRESNEPVVHQK